MLNKRDRLIGLTLFIILSLFLMGLILSCATTSKGKLIETQNTFKAIVKTYNTEMDLQQNEAVKQEWRKTFPPLFEDMNKALKAYESAVLQGFGAEQKMELVLLLKNQILLKFIRANIEFNIPKEEVK